MTYPSELNANDTAVTGIGTTSTQILPDLRGGDSSRKGYVITNVSTGGQVISLSLGSPAVANSGTVLYPGGSVWEFRDNESDPYQGIINGVSSATGGALAVSERIDIRPNR